MIPLHLAAESGRIKILGYFIEQGADINIQDDNGVIIYDMHTSAARYLIEVDLPTFPGRYCIHFQFFTC